LPPRVELPECSCKTVNDVKYRTDYSLEFMFNHDEYDKMIMSKW